MGGAQATHDFAGLPFAIRNFESSGTLARIEFDCSVFAPGMAVLLGVDFAVSGFIPNTLVAEAGWDDGGIFYADAQTFDEGRSHAQWNGELLLDPSRVLVCSVNTTAAV